MTPRSKSGQAIFFDLSERAKFRVAGADRFRFLNGQVTNDLRKADGKAAIEACVLNAKGKIDAHIFVHADGEHFLVDAQADLREILKARLERYIIADDVEIEEVTDQFSLFHVLSQESPVVDGARTVSARRFAEAGWDIWIDAARHAALLEQLSSGWILCAPELAETMRIEQGIPSWGRELTPDIIPIEANLEQRTINYEKGCYIGQEVISRMKMSGQTNKRLCGLISLRDTPLQPGMKVASPVTPGKEVGWITSATRSERIGKEIGLAYLKRGFNNAHTKLDAFATESPALKPGPIPVEVVPLPFI